MVPFSISSFFLYFHMFIYLNYATQLLHHSMLQLQFFDTYSNMFSSMEQQLHKGKFPLMLFKNITKKIYVKERIFRTTQATFVTELWTGIVQDLKKLTSWTTVVRIHLQFHPHFSHTNCLHQFSAAFFCCAVVYYIVQYINCYFYMSRLRVFWLHQMHTQPPSSLYVPNATLMLLPLLS